MKRAVAPDALLRRLPIGAELHAGGAHFRVWAPDRRTVSVVLDHMPDRHHPLEPEREGYFSGWIADLSPGMRYRYWLDGERLAPDPASRWQPEGPHGPSALVDPAAFSWSDAAWTGIDPTEAVLYELHVGTFTAEGTWRAAQAQLPYLADLGITVIELMPVADFPGRFGWGYDGVNLFAPHHGYGTPEDMRRFIDSAHRTGLGVILDVVYNHFGPDGNYLPWFTVCYRGKRPSEWGDAPNFDGERCNLVREFYLANAAYWIDEFHLDGLRIDATQQIFDDSPEHILRPVVRRAREAGRLRRIFIAAESEPQRVELLRPQHEGGFGCDALWNDDFHHSARVAATGRNEAYYSDYRGTPQELLSAIKHGFLYQGQYYAWQKQPRGTPTKGLAPHAFIHFLENHDQIANSHAGQRLHQLTSPGRLRALTALLLLGPQIPLIFQGQEFASSRPFCYFADHTPALAQSVRRGRFEFLAQFPSMASEASRVLLPNPEDPATFAASKLDLDERQQPMHAQMLTLYRDLLRLRREDATLRRAREVGCDGAVLAAEAFVLRLFGEQPEDDRLLLINLGSDLHGAAIAEPMLAPPLGRRWRLHWSSEDPRYGGGGIAPFDTDTGWRLSGHAAILLNAVTAKTTTP